MYSVVNIGGMSHTGSTLLGRIIANDDRVMYLGEIEALFRPTRKHHYEHIHRLSKGEMWSDILQCSVHSFYSRILQKCGNKEMLVDCSKNPLWIGARNIDCQHMRIKHRNVLIYKTPYEMAESYEARKKSWAPRFDAYFRRYFRCVDEFYIIAYRDLVESPSSLRKLCDYLGISYSGHKKNYWENDVEEIFGSEKANKHRKLSYEYNLTPEQEAGVRRTLGEHPVAARLWTVLEKHRDRVSSSYAKDFKELSASKPELSLWATAHKVKGAYRRVFPEDYFKKRMVQ